MRSFAKFSLSNIEINRNAVLLFTDRFRVVIPRNKQTVPGVLRLELTKPELNDWQNWSADDWSELIKTQRLIEFLLIEALDKDQVTTNPSTDTKLVNLFGKQRRYGDKTEIYFDIAPRYSKPITITAGDGTCQFQDELFGKPFDFSKTVALSDQIYNEIVNILRTSLSIIKLDKYNLEDDFSKKWDSCFNCKHPSHHPDEAGLIEAESKLGLRFAMTLDSRSQEEKGRAFLDPYLHIPALRYWDDELMPVVGEAFQYYIKTVNDCYKAPEGREFDFAILMNLARPPAGTHTHFHFIPRTPNGKNYGSDFQMDAKTYIPLTKDTQERKRIVQTFSDTLCKYLSQSGGLTLKWQSQPDAGPGEVVKSQGLFSVQQQVKTEASETDKSISYGQGKS